MNAMGFRRENGSDPLAEDYYMFNSYGDVLILVDGSGKLVVKYIYDTCGQHLTSTGSMKDPLAGIIPRMPALFSFQRYEGCPGRDNPLRYRRLKCVFLIESQHRTRGLLS